MADPTKFTPGYAYTISVIPNFPGTKFDQDFTNVETSIGTIVDAIKEVRRSDGALQNGIVTVDSLSAAVKAIFGVTPALGTIALNIDDIVTTADSILSVNTVAGVSVDVSTVAAVSAAVSTVAAVSADVIAVAAIDSEVTTVANNITDVSAFFDVYLGAKASDPATRNDLSALVTGDLYFNSTTKTMHVYDGVAWADAIAQALTHNLTEKTTPVDADEVRIADSEATFGFKKLTFASLKAWAKSFLPITKSYESGELTIIGSGAFTLAHGLGGTPKLAQFFLRCKTADRGWLVGDEIPVGTSFYTSSAGSTRGLTASLASVNISFRIGAEMFAILNKDTGTMETITSANWKLIVRAWA